MELFKYCIVLFYDATVANPLMCRSTFKTDFSLVFYCRIDVQKLKFEVVKGIKSIFFSQAGATFSVRSSRVWQRSLKTACPRCLRLSGTLDSIVFSNHLPPSVSIVRVLCKVIATPVKTSKLLKIKIFFYITKTFFFKFLFPSKQ